MLLVSFHFLWHVPALTMEEESHSQYITIFFDFINFSNSRSIHHGIKAYDIDEIYKKKNNAINILSDKSS